MEERPENRQTPNQGLAEFILFLGASVIAFMAITYLIAFGVIAGAGFLGYKLGSGESIKVSDLDKIWNLEIDKKRHLEEAPEHLHPMYDDYFTDQQKEYLLPKEKKRTVIDVPLEKAGKVATHVLKRKK